MLEGREVQQHQPLAARRGRCAAGDAAASIWRRDAGACLAFGANPRRCTWRSWMATRRNRGRQPGLPRPHLSFRRRASPAGDSTGAHHQRSVRTVSRRACPTPAPGSITTIGACASRWAIASTRRRSAAPYRFLPVEGDGLHQIAVGPVHAGIIEPGHFRFTASGETVVRLEAAAGLYPQGHRGADGGRRSRSRGQARRARLGRQHRRLCLCVFARAAEAALELAVPDRAVWLRALLAELERLANHLGDIGAICNDASFALMHAHCGVLRESVLRAADTALRSSPDARSSSCPAASPAISTTTGSEAIQAALR